mmetsp:Transcript_148776/g.257681  ORF Transcript_148776/g.257681 Transcript_148776/m.257681 type:complete len:272 (-) Transcript_148776:1447-2262(-)
MAERCARHASSFTSGCRFAWTTSLLLPEPLATPGGAHTQEPPCCSSSAHSCAPVTSQAVDWAPSSSPARAVLRQPALCSLPPPAPMSKSTTDRFRTEAPDAQASSQLYTWVAEVPKRTCAGRPQAVANSWEIRYPFACTQNLETRPYRIHSPSTCGKMTVSASSRNHGSHQEQRPEYQRHPPCAAESQWISSRIRSAGDAPSVGRTCGKSCQLRKWRYSGRPLEILSTLEAHLNPMRLLHDQGHHMCRLSEPLQGNPDSKTQHHVWSVADA